MRAPLVVHASARLTALVQSQVAQQARTMHTTAVAVHVPLLMHTRAAVVQVPLLMHRQAAVVRVPLLMHGRVMLPTPVWLPIWLRVMVAMKLWLKLAPSMR